jgi:hypothetical protein
MNKPKASSFISDIKNPSSISIEFVCKECGNVVTPGSLYCSKCNSALIDGMDPILNRILSFIILLGIPIFVGLIIGKVDKGLILGTIIGAFLATFSKMRIFKSQGIWAMMRMSDSIILDFVCPIATWKEGKLPILIHFREYGGIINIFKSQFQRLNEQERSIVKNIIDSILKPTESNLSVNVENKQIIQPVNQSEDNSINEQKISLANQPKGNSIINITRPSRTLGLALVFDGPVQ